MSEGNGVKEVLEKVDTPERNREEKELKASYPTKIYFPEVYGTAEEIEKIGFVDALWKTAQALADFDKDNKITHEEFLKYIEGNPRISALLKQEDYMGKKAVPIDQDKKLPDITRDDYQQLVDGAIAKGKVKKLGILDGNRNGELDKGDLPLNIADLMGVAQGLHAGIGIMDPLILSAAKQGSVTER